jgi:hypothetical protein
MATHATITLHPVWGCRWSAEAAEGRWVCTVDGRQRFIDEHECATCLFWEQAAEHAHQAAAAHPHILEIAVRAVLVLAAILFVATGVAVLTGPSMVPFTIALWLGAAGLLGLATFARLSTN